MFARKVGAIKYRSASALAGMYLKKGKLSLSEIADKCGITPQTVLQKKKQMISNGLLG